MKLHAVVAQFPVSLSIQKNLAYMDAVLALTRPGDLVVFPEGAVSGYDTDPSFLTRIDQAELAMALAHLQNEACQRNIHVWAGVCVHQEGQWLNAAYGFFADGATGVYHKINLANHERGTFSTGDRLPVFDLDTSGGKLRLGVQICREVRFPEQWRWLALQGVQIFVHLNNATGIATPQPVWRSFLVSRAAENQRYVLSANNAAPKQISPTLAVAPDGQIIEELVSAEPGILRVELDLSTISELYLQQCRTDLIALRETRKMSG